MFNFFRFLRSCLNRGQTRATARQPVRHANFRSQLFLENLEERLVPTIVFQPQLGVETQAQGNNQALNSQTVRVIYWGPNTVWTTALMQQDNSAISQLLASPYLSGTTQYGSNGAATLGGSTPDTDALPSSVNQVQIQNQVSLLIQESILPIAGNTNLYVVLTPTTEPASFTQDNWVNNFTPLIWVGANATASVDNTTLALSGQLADSLSDPGNQGYQVNPGSTYATNVGNHSPGQIADFEPKAYEFRMSDGVVVQPYWSKNDNAFIVPDGVTQKQITVEPIWVGAGLTAFGQNYNLVLTGSLPSANAITIATTSGNGISLTANGETATFDLDGIQNIDVVEQGQLTVVNSATPATLTLQTDPNQAGIGFVNGFVGGTSIQYAYASTTKLTLITDSTVNVQATGTTSYILGDSSSSNTVNVGNSSVGVQGIQGTLNISNATTTSTPTAIINITDAADTNGVHATVVNTTPLTPGAWTSITGLAPATIQFSPGVANNLAITTSPMAGNTLTLANGPTGNGTIDVGGSLALAAPTIMASGVDLLNAGKVIALTGNLSTTNAALILSTPNVTLSGGTSPRTLVVTPTANEVTLNNNVISLTGVTNFVAMGGAADSATLNDTAGSALFVGTPTYSSLQGSGFTAVVVGYGKVQAISTHSASDTANFATATGSDLFQGTPAWSAASGTGYANTADGFGTVHCWSGGTSTVAPSTAYLATSVTGSDTMGGVPTYSFVQGSNYAIYAIGFVNVDAYAEGPAIAYLGMTSGHDTFSGLPTYSAVTGANYSYSICAVGFAQTQGYSGGPNCSAILKTTATGHDTYVGTPTYSYVSGTGYLAFALDFANVDAYAGGGNSVGYLTTSSGTDFFLGSAAFSQATNGTGGSYNNFAIGFANVGATAGSSNSVAAFNDAPGSNTFSGSGTQALESGSGYNVSGTGFGAVALSSPNGGNDTSSTSALDYAFAEYGNWK